MEAFVLRVDHAWALSFGSLARIGTQHTRKGELRAQRLRVCHEKNLPKILSNRQGLPGDKTNPRSCSAAAAASAALRVDGQTLTVG